jgi:glycerate 2-kinase
MTVAPCTEQIKIAIAPDSFKGTLTAAEVAAALATGLQQALPQATLYQWPLADGGEGTLAAIQTVWGGGCQSWSVENAMGSPIQAPLYCRDIAARPTAVIEVAQIVGIADQQAMQHSVLQRTTRGVGQLMQHALDQSMRQFYVGLGGSCTNDGGAGLMVGLGARLFNAQRQILPPTPEGLRQLAQVDFSGLPTVLLESNIVVLSDVASPLCGPEGATYTFGPQKGLTDALERHQCDHTLAHFAQLAETAMQPLMPHRPLTGLHTQPGTGAAGGLGFALQLLGGTYRSGAAFIAELWNIPQRLQHIDWLITGEGRSDHQTLQGKAPWMVARLAQEQQVPVTLLSGQIAIDNQVKLEEAFGSRCYSLMPGPACCFRAPDAPQDLKDCCRNAYQWLIKAGFHLGQQQI